MISCETQIRVRYGETDRMGYLHHSVYPLYFEEGRTELLRRLGMDYKQMEDSGILLPVRNLSITYFMPAYYDDILIVKTELKKNPTAKIIFDYTVQRDEQKLCEAQTTLVFVDSDNRKPVRPPEGFLTLLKEKIN
jgi:acyl-CoA thioester hydrolase